VKLERIASEFYTVNEVFDEVRDRQARLTLQTFPFEIKVRQPHPSAIKAVVDFSKKTGDFYGLSNTDIKILALTLTLEREVNGIEHIRTEPLLQASKKSEPSSQSDNSSIASNEETKEELNEHKDEEEVEEEQQEEEEEQEQEQQKEEEKVDNPLTQQSPQQPTSSRRDDDDEGGWITPENIKQVKLKTQGEFETLEHVKVGCITTDFSMQNVLLQIGLNLISIDGMKIKKLKQWILKCQTCSKYT